MNSALHTSAGKRCFAAQPSDATADIISSPCLIRVIQKSQPHEIYIFVEQSRLGPLLEESEITTNYDIFWVVGGAG